MIQWKWNIVLFISSLFYYTEKQRIRRTNCFLIKFCQFPRKTDATEHHIFPLNVNKSSDAARGRQVHSNAINACRVSLETPPFCKANRPRRENWLWRQFRCGHVCYPTTSGWSATQQKPLQSANTANRSVNIATGVIINSFNYTIFTALYSSLQTHGGNLPFYKCHRAVLSLGMFILTVSNRPRALCIHYEKKGLLKLNAVWDPIK